MSFFDRHWDRGLSWYASFFSDAPTIGGLRIGEFTPSYLSQPEAPERIGSVLPNCQFLVILRHPVDRAYSQWKYRLQKRAEKRDFETWFKEQDEPVELGRYATHLERYYARFPASAFKILVLEEVVQNPGKSLAQVLRFLGVEALDQWLPPSSARRNESFKPRFPGAYNYAFRVKQLMRDSDFDHLVNLLKRVGMERAFGRRRGPGALEPDVKLKLTSVFDEEIARVEDLLMRPIPTWH